MAYVLNGVAFEIGSERTDAWCNEWSGLEFVRVGVCSFASSLFFPVISDDRLVTEIINSLVRVCTIYVRRLDVEYASEAFEMACVDAFSETV